MTRAARTGAEDDVRRMIPDVPALLGALDEVDYLADEGLATALFLAVRLPQPILLEGEPGVGKTEAAKAAGRLLDTPLFRLQCYEGIDSGEALYEWNYPRQLLGIRLAEARQASLAETELFGPEYLLRRPLLQAIEHQGPRPAVLLLDEIDRADAEFEAFTFELLAEAAVTIPELGTVRATHPPIVILTSNRTRDLHDALTRRCLNHWIDYPTPQRIAEIVRCRVPESGAQIALQAASAITRLRSLDLAKPPGVAEAIDWVSALTVLGVDKLDPGRVDQTCGSILKNRDDLDLAVGRRRVAGGRSWLTGGHWASGALITSGRAVPTSKRPHWRSGSARRCAERASRVPRTDPLDWRRPSGWFRRTSESRCTGRAGWFWSPPGNRYPCSTRYSTQCSPAPSTRPTSAVTRTLRRQSAPNHAPGRPRPTSGRRSRRTRRRCLRRRAWLRAGTIPGTLTRMRRSGKRSW
ncbi:MULTISPECIES: MoxR family ATPase [unclassified Cryobacterium]|uniref:AAA family ATPase n=1 Tax=unclassified Cryobacterium TaxID=2649013 RepID=UPI001F540060|nr:MULTISPECIES: MoxR family ATPase [unclassified Cryobacterium]